MEIINHVLETFFKQRNIQFRELNNDCKFMTDRCLPMCANTTRPPLIFFETMLTLKLISGLWTASNCPQSTMSTQLSRQESEQFIQEEPIPLHVCGHRTST